MQIHLEQTPVESLECDALIALTFEGAPNDRFKESLSDVYGSGEITGKIFEMTLVHRPQGFKAQGLPTNSLPPRCAAWLEPRCVI